MPAWLVKALKVVGTWLFRKVIKRAIKEVTKGAKSEYFELCEWFGEELSRLGNKYAAKVGLNYNRDIEPTVLEGFPYIEKGAMKN